MPGNTAAAIQRTARCTVYWAPGQHGQAEARLVSECPASPRQVYTLSHPLLMALSITDGVGLPHRWTGHHAFIGMGFRDRSDSYDFNAAMQDHWKWVQRCARQLEPMQIHPASVGVTDRVVAVAPGG